MGDSGSTLIGLLLSVLAIKAIETPNADVSDTIIAEMHRPIFVMSVLSYPLLDTLRIFVYRTVKGVSPFEADRNHIHHALLDTGLNHKGVALTLYGANLLIIAIAVISRGLSPTVSFIIVFVCAAALAQLPFFFKKKKTSGQNLKNGVNGNGHSKVSEEAKKKLFHEEDF